MHRYIGASEYQEQNFPAAWGLGLYIPPSVPWWAICLPTKNQVLS